MIAVIFEVEPHAERRDDYLRIAKALPLPTGFATPESENRIDVLIQSSCQ